MTVPRNPFTRVCRLLLAGLCCLAGLPCLAAYTFTVTPDHPHTMYALNQEIRFQVDLTHDGVPVTSGLITFLLDSGERDERNGGTYDLSAGPLVLATARSEPGIVRCHVSYTIDAQTTLYALAVVGVGLEALRPSMPPPPDFDVYWQTQRSQVTAMPLSATTRPVPAGVPNVD